MLPQDGMARYFAFSTRVGEKVLTTAIGLGSNEGFSEIGQRALAVAIAHAGDKKEIIVVPVAAATAKKRAQLHVERTLRAVPHGSLVFICCEDSKTYDLASPGLHITINGVDIGDPAVRHRARANWEAQGKPSREPTETLMRKVDDDWRSRKDHA
jgi:hypothetical protein